MRSPRPRALVTAPLLVGHGVGEHAGRDGEGLFAVRDGGLAQEGFKPEPGVAVGRRSVGDDPGFFRVLDFDGVRLE